MAPHYRPIVHTRKACSCQAGLSVYWTCCEGSTEHLSKERSRCGASLDAMDRRRTLVLLAGLLAFFPASAVARQLEPIEAEDLTSPITTRIDGRLYDVS